MKAKIRILCIALLTGICLAGCTPEPDTETPAGTSAVSSAADTTAPALSYHQISQEEAKKMMQADDNHVIVDVRTQEEFDAGHIPGALLIPNETITDTPPDALPVYDQIILIYCRSGNRSKQAAAKLAAMGYTNLYEFGGINTWDGEIVTGNTADAVTETVTETAEASTEAPTSAPTEPASAASETTAPPSAAAETTAPPTEPQTEAEPAPPAADWKAAYRAQLDAYQNAPGYDPSASWDLRDLDGDGIPELLISEASYHIGRLQIYYCNGSSAETMYLNDGVRMQFGSYGSVLLYPEEHLMIESDMHMGYYNAMICRCENHTLVPVATFSEDSGAVGEAQATYTVNGVSVSRDQYNSEFQAYAPENWVEAGLAYKFGDYTALN